MESSIKEFHRSKPHGKITTVAVDMEIINLLRRCRRPEHFNYRDTAKAALKEYGRSLAFETKDNNESI